MTDEQRNEAAAREGEGRAPSDQQPDHLEQGLGDAPAAVTDHTPERPRPDFLPADASGPGSSEFAAPGSAPTGPGPSGSAGADPAGPGSAGHDDGPPSPGWGELGAGGLGRPGAGAPDFAAPGSAPEGVREHRDAGTGTWGNPAGDTAAFPVNIAPMTGPTPYPGREPGPAQGQGYDPGRYGGHPPPPPPARAFGMGPGWAPPPPPPGPPGGAPGGGSAHGRRPPSVAALAAIAVVIALVAGAAGSIGTYLATRGGSDGTDPDYSLGASPTGRVERAPESVAGVASRVLPSVVSIEISGGAEGGTSGSGFLVKGGYVVTNNHVAAPASQGATITLQFSNRKTTSGRIVGRDPGSDLAVLKPDQTFGLAEVALGDSDSVVVGDEVIAIGSPLGLSGTVTLGIISSLNRPVVAGGESGVMDTSYINAIQTDAAINPGNSGGPLVNGKGEVIGVNSAIATLGRSPTSGQGGSIGLGFAIPMNHARRVIEDLVTTGSAKTSRIGISIDTSYQGQGVRIASQADRGQLPVEKGGPADKAGLRPGDVITELNGSPVQNAEELMVQIRSKAPGEKITVKFQRGGKEQSTTVTVAAGAVPSPQPS
ncbi:trypsin-like peptidase domain-containing protein [Spongiactinospora sp. 9N601]|uniref:S1C family serine protease n=1 Tax=Spongiactinospora sp. 9N601 TaxID=3375149 RepID=UPI0037AB4394